MFMRLPLPGASPTVWDHMSFRFGIFAALGLLALSTLSGCAGLYVEAQASLYPSLTSTPSSTPKTGTAAAGAPVVSGASSGLGLAAGIDFDISREHRFALGYQSIATHMGGGGKTSGGSSDARFDLKILSLGESARLRLAGGFGFGTGSSTGYKDKTGATLAAKTDANAGAAYIGPAFSEYIGGHHELTAMLGAQYYFASIPGGSLGGAGVVGKLTYTFHIVNSWPEIFFERPMGTDKNIMPLVEAGAEAAGCTAQSHVSRDNTAASLLVRCPKMGPVFFVQTSNNFGGFCQHMSRKDCNEVVDLVFKKTLELLPPETPPAATETPAAPAPAPAAPVPSPSGDVPPPAADAPTAPTPSSVDK